MNILVVGAGPVGLSAALLFSQAGYSVRCIDCKKEPSRHSKAMVIHDSILMGLLSHLDLYSSFVRQGHFIKELSIFDNRKSLYLFKPEMQILSISQEVTEKILATKVKVDWEYECINVNRQGTAWVRSPTGEVQKEKYDLIVGADGAHSTVRSLLNIPFKGEQFKETWYLADIELNKGAGERGELHLLNQGKLEIWLPLSDTALRLFTNSKEIFDRIEEKKWVKKVLWQSVYHISQRCVPSYAEGRVALIGDAAHLSTPVGGTGMNMGMEDAYTLLAHLQKEGIEKGLASWSVERYRIQKKVLFWTTLVYRILTSKSRWVRRLGIQLLFSFPRSLNRLFSHFRHASRGDR